MLGLIKFLARTTINVLLLAVIVACVAQSGLNTGQEDKTPMPSKPAPATKSPVEPGLLRKTVSTGGFGDEIPKPVQDGPIVGLAGATYLIDRSQHLYYLVVNDRPVVIHIPTICQDGLLGQEFGTGPSPNEVGISGYFRFIGNTQGRNMFGVEVPLELYEAVPRAQWPR